jgi:hypothetical protein
VLNSLCPRACDIFVFCFPLMQVVHIAPQIAYLALYNACI